MSSLDAGASVALSTLAREVVLNTILAKNCHPERWNFIIITTNIIISSYALSYDYPVSSGLITLDDPSSTRSNLVVKPEKSRLGIEINDC